MLLPVTGDGLLLLLPFEEGPLLLPAAAGGTLPALVLAAGVGAPVLLLLAEVAGFGPGPCDTAAASAAA